MLEDWQNDTCEGKYLKSLYERKVKKNKDLNLLKPHALTYVVFHYFCTYVRREKY